LDFTPIPIPLSKVGEVGLKVHGIGLLLTSTTRGAEDKIPFFFCEFRVEIRFAASKSLAVPKMVIPRQYACILKIELNMEFIRIPMLFQK